MTALVLDRIATLPALARSVRVLLSRLGNAIDNVVSALAARKVPAWRMAEIQQDLARQLQHIGNTARRD